MNREQIIKTLRNDEEYYNGLGRNYLSASDIGTLLTNPKMFGVKKPKEKPLIEGSYFHQSILEPEKAVNFPWADCASRNTNIYKDLIKDTGEEIFLLRPEKEEVDQLVGLMKSNPIFFDEIYDPENEFEVPQIGEIFGMPFKGKADIKGPEFLIDLKTTSDINDFRWSAKKYNYDSQAFIYQQLFSLPLYFLVVCKKTGMLGRYMPSQEFINSGEVKVKMAIQQYHKFFGPNKTHDVNQFFFDEIL